MRITALTALSLAVAVSASTTEARADPAPYQLEIGPSVAYVKQHAGSDGSGVTYGGGSALGVMMRITFLPWLRGAVRYQQAGQSVSYGNGALGVPTPLSSNGASIDTLSAYVHPTFSPLARLHLWGTVGASWSYMAVPTVHGADGSVQRGRAGIFADVPLGVGAGFDVLRWLTASLDLQVAPAFAPSGDLFVPDIYYDAAGKPQITGAFPAPTSTLYVMGTLAIALLGAGAK